MSLMRARLRGKAERSFRHESHRNTEYTPKQSCAELPEQLKQRLKMHASTEQVNSRKHIKPYTVSM